LPDVDRSLSALAPALAETVRAAGDVALRTFRQPLRQWIKGESSPVSEADIAVNDFLRERLLGLAGGYGWMSEENEDDPARLEAENVWIVDPIDGTRAYLAGQDDWTVSVALAARGRPTLGAVFAPVSQELFLAVAGGGATRNGVAIAASSGSDITGAKVVGPKRHINWLAGLNANAMPVPRIGSIALRLARVAQGVLDVAFAGGNSHDWDLAAADLLVHEAGGALTTMAGEALTYNSSELVHGALLAAGQERHAALIGLVRNHPELA
jgi:myo-inositol-1(or 4)-monophosphatase